MGKYPWFPVKIFPTKPIHGLWRDLTSWPKPGCLWWMFLGEWSQPISQYDHALSWWMYRRTINSNDPNIYSLKYQVSEWVYARINGFIEKHRMEVVVELAPNLGLRIGIFLSTNSGKSLLMIL
jgi:hypothetical protein